MSIHIEGNEYVLKMRLLEHIYADQLIDRATVRIILPEYAADIELTAPYAVERAPDSLHFTYLDTVGRPVVEVAVRSAADSHIQEFQLKYTCPKVVVLKKPLVLVAAFLLVFLAIIVAVRIDFSLAPFEAVVSAGARLLWSCGVFLAT